jgi:hypothetical protein
MTFGNYTVLDEHNGHAPVVEGMQSVVGIDIALLRLDSKRAEGGQCVIAEVAALAGDENDVHDPRLLGTRLGG